MNEARWSPPSIASALIRIDRSSSDKPMSLLPPCLACLAPSRQSFAINKPTKRMTCIVVSVQFPRPPTSKVSFPPFIRYKPACPLWPLSLNLWLLLPLHVWEQYVQLVISHLRAEHKWAPNSATIDSWLIPCRIYSDPDISSRSDFFFFFEKSFHWSTTGKQDPFKIHFVHRLHRFMFYPGPFCAEF
jgi:hypothetical protein